MDVHEAIATEPSLGSSFIEQTYEELQTRLLRPLLFSNYKAQLVPIQMRWILFERSPFS